MPENIIDNLSRLCLHTITTKPWHIETAVEKYAAAGVSGITVWRDTLEGKNIASVSKLINDAGFSIVSLCRGGFFPGIDESSRRTNLDDNLKAVDEAAELGAPMIVLVPGAVPGLPLENSRDQIRNGIEYILPRAESAGVKLAIEPLHPMYADDRSAINTLRQANDMAEAIGSPFVGVAIDIYHLWWDPDLQTEIARCGKNGNLFAFHICDWNTPTKDLLLDRGLMGEGCINIKQIRGWVEDTGFTGFHEVEIFSTTFWAMDQNRFLEKIITAYRKHS